MRKKDLDRSIISIAQEELLTTGLRKFSIDQFSTQHHISKKTIYQIFPTKEAFINAVLLDFYETIFQEIQSLPENGKNPLQQLFVVVKLIIDKLAKIYPQIIYEIKLYYPQVWHRIEEFQHDIIKRLVTYLRAAQKQGLIRADLNLEFIALLVMQIAQYTFQPEFFIRSSFSLPDLVKNLVDLIFNGMLTNPNRIEFDALG